MENVFGPLEVFSVTADESSSTTNFLPPVTEINFPHKSGDNNSEYYNHAVMVSMRIDGAGATGTHKLFRTTVQLPKLDFSETYENNISLPIQGTNDSLRVIVNLEGKLDHGCDIQTATISVYLDDALLQKLELPVNFN